MMLAGAGADLVLAHGVSSRQDLPLPFGFAVTGAIVALAVSFLALGVLWRTPRFRGNAGGRPLPAGLGEFLNSAEVRWALRILGLLLTGFVAFAAIAGPDLANNPTAGLVYVVFWVGLVPASLVFGPVWKYLNPLRTIYALITKVLRLDPDDPPFALPARLGYWPAALSLFSFVWLELCAPNRASTGTLITFFSMYAGFQLLGALLFGGGWFERGDGLEAFSTLIGRLSILGRRDDGVLVLRNPLENLDGLREAPGLVPLVGVMLGSTAFDSITSTPWWLEITYDSSISVSTLALTALTGAVLLVISMFFLASYLAGVLGRSGGVGTATKFAHSLVPIAVGYLIAHYFTLLVFAGQQAIIHSSDPLVNESNWFGTADWKVDYNVMSSGFIAGLQVTVIVIGHVLGVFSAHDRSVKIFPAREAVVGQLPMMILMITYTFGGLSLLFAG